MIYVVISKNLRLSGLIHILMDIKEKKLKLWVLDCL